MKKRSFVAIACAAAIALAGCGTSTAPTQSSSGASSSATVVWPEPGKTIQVFIGYAPGGATDAAGRVIADALATETGARVQVVNQEGAATALAQQAMISQPKDGYSMVMINMPGMLGYLYNGEEAPVERSEFLPIANVTLMPNGLFVQADSPYQTINDLVEAAKTSTLNVGDNGAADDAIVLGAIEQQGGVKFNRVVYNGTGEKIQALLSGDIVVFSGALGGVKAQLDSGDFRLIAQMSGERSSLATDVQTAVEQGWDIVYDTTQGLAFAAGVPEEIRQAAEDAVKKVAESQAFIDKQAAASVAVNFQTGAEFSEFWGQQETFIAEAAQKYKS